MNHNNATPEESYNLAQELAASGRYAEAVEAYSVALASEPGLVKARCGRGMAYQRIGENAKAIADFDEVISCYPDWSGAFIAYYSRASSRHALGYASEAIEDCDEALRRKPDLAAALYLRGAARKELGRFGAAASDMDAVLQINPGYHEAYFVRGSLHCLAQRWEQAIDDFAAALEHGIGETGFGRTCFYLRGMAAQELGHHLAAIADFTRAIELDPADSAAHFRRSRSYREMGDLELAEADIQVVKQMLRRKPKGGT